MAFSLPAVVKHDCSGEQGQRVTQQDKAGRVDRKAAAWMIRCLEQRFGAGLSGRRTLLRRLTAALSVHDALAAGARPAGVLQRHGRGTEEEAHGCRVDGWSVLEIDEVEAAEFNSADGTPARNQGSPGRTRSQCPRPAQRCRKGCRQRQGQSRRD